MNTLYIVATPIGNLEDISKRALRMLSEVDLILCEDTRVTKKLLNYYGIKTPVLSYHQHSKLRKIDYILELLRGGKKLALVSDAGTPGISDPGNQLIHEISAISQSARSYALENKELEVKVVPIPGPSAVTAAASISGFPMDKFIFLGFPPTKKKRKKFFEEAVNSKYPVIFYESPHRIIKTLEELRIMNKELKIVVARELTKKFETIYRGNIEKVIEGIKKDGTKGEFVVVIKGKN
jgi:16S rRNA (cytidine1402-2'-O)-methyltransferase